jgi:exopolyphosphatase/guanosine-5'-triphosphate,3'-diphosphate pyrophosphatase
LDLRRYDRGQGRRAADDQRADRRVIREYLALGPEGRRTDPRIGRDRHALIMSGAAILQALMRIWPTDRLSVADRGLREGLLYAQMSADGVLEDGPIHDEKTHRQQHLGRGSATCGCGSRPRRGGSCRRRSGWSGS